MRLTEIGREVGLVNDKRYEKFLHKKQIMQNIEKKLEQKVKVDEKLKELFEENDEVLPKESMLLRDLMKRTNIDIYKLDKTYHLFDEEEQKFLEFVNTNIKYEGYLKQQQEDIDKMLANEKVSIPENFEYKNLKGIRIEALEKLAQIRPLNIGQASRISGVSPSDVAVLSVLVKKYNGNFLQLN